MDTTKQRAPQPENKAAQPLSAMAQVAKTAPGRPALTTKDNYDAAMHRIDAWYEGAVIDRPPVRFAGHNAQYNVLSSQESLSPQQRKQAWFDTEQVVSRFIESIRQRRFLAESFPIYWPNLGPDVFAAFYGCDLTFGEVTSWSRPVLKSWQDLDNLQIDLNSEYFRKIEELTLHALERCDGRFLVGYTDLHPGMDCVLAWRGMEQLCYDLIDAPDEVRRGVQAAGKDFRLVFDHFDFLLKTHGQSSVCWMEIPSLATFHVPSCDFATMMSPKQFASLALPAIQDEIKHTTHNVFHLDGKGVARHVDAILDLPRIQAIQWAQGMGEDQPIMQWIPLLKRIRAAGKSVIVDLQKHELEDFIAEMPPEGLFLWIAENDESQQREIIKRLENW
ncbi:MAG: hypothetical protein JW741_23190 [Sedimentisphaerales bacterium]|nr:hypothetical protein [Sedimentisphaerales bacterium]